VRKEGRGGRRRKEEEGEGRRREEEEEEDGRRGKRRRGEGHRNILEVIDEVEPLLSLVEVEEFFIDGLSSRVILGSVL